MLYVFLAVAQSHQDTLQDAYKDHMTKCGSGMTSDGKFTSFAGGADTRLSKSMGGEYDKYGRRVSDDGLLKQGFVSKGGLSRMLSNSLESGLNLKEATNNARMGAFNANISPVNPFVGTFGDGQSVAGGRDIRGYRDKGDGSLLETNNPAILGNIKCKYPSNGYGHLNCSDDKIVGEHYDLSNMVGPYRVNAHYESPSKVMQPLHHESYHANAYKDMLMMRRVGFTEHDLLQRSMGHAQQRSNCKIKQPNHERGVDRFITPMDEFHEI